MTDHPPDEALVAEALRCLSRLDRRLWWAIIARRLRNPDSTLWIHVPKDGVVATTLGVASRLWLLPCWAVFPGLVLVDLNTHIAVVTALGYLLIAFALVAFGIGFVDLVRASRARRAWKRAHA